MRTSLIAAATGLLLLFGASAASANGPITTDFEGFALGDVSGQFGWSPTLAVGSVFGPYDQGVVTPGINSLQALRVSSQTASGGFGGWIFSSPATKAGENEANPGFTSTFSFKALGSQLDGSHLSISPDDGQGNRLSYVRLEDNAAGVQVFFDDTPWGSSGTAFVE